MFIAALFTIAKAWRQPKCPSTEEWKKKMWYIYTMEDIRLRKMSDKERQILYDITYHIISENKTNE